MSNTEQHSDSTARVPLGGDYWQADPGVPLWGFADLHAHLMAHLAFGGKAFWGLPFDPKHTGTEAIEYALASCEPIHGGLVNINPELGHEAVPERLKLTEQFSVLLVPLEDNVRPIQYLLLFRTLVLSCLPGVPLAHVAKRTADDPDHVPSFVEPNQHFLSEVDPLLADELPSPCADTINCCPSCRS